MHLIDQRSRAAGPREIARRELDGSQQRQRGARVDALLDRSHGGKSTAPITTITTPLLCVCAAPIAALTGRLARLAGHGTLCTLTCLCVERWRT